MKNYTAPFKNPGAGTRGFSLVELMITMVIAAVITGAIYAAYHVQQKSYVVQEQVAETQQNIRAAMVRLLDEIRPSGCDPDSTGAAGTRILEATATRFRFTQDIAGDPVNPNEGDGDTDDANEDVAFGLDITDDANNDGIVDGGGGAATNWSVAAPLRRGDALADAFDDAVLPPPPAIAELVDAIEFNYILADNSFTTTPANPNKIRAVQVSILARGARPDPDAKFVDRSLYRTASGAVWDPPDDNFRRRFVIVTIKCRNMEYGLW